MSAAEASLLAIGGLQTHGHRLQASSYRKAQHQRLSITHRHRLPVGASLLAIGGLQATSHRLQVSSHMASAGSACC